MDLSYSSLSGCCVSLVIGFSYFFRLKPHPEVDNRAETAITVKLDLEKRIIIEESLRLYFNGRRILRQRAHFLKSGPGIHSVKNGSPRHYPFNARIYHICNVFRVYTAVDLDGKVQSAFLFPRHELPHLVERIGYELLAAETGIDAHNQHIINNVQHVVEHGHRGPRVNYHAGARALTLNHAKGP